MSHQSEPEPSNFTTLFESALEEYAKQTGKPWAEHPLAKQLEQCYSLESVSDVLREQAQAFTRSRGDSRIAKSLKSAISILYTLSTNTALRDAISVPFPPAKPIFAAFAVLLGAAKDVSASHDALAELLEKIEQSLNRLEIYTKVTLERAMVELIVKMMVQLLHVLGVVTKEIKRNPLIKIGKKLSGDSVIEVALQKLNQLNVTEGLTVTAQILEHTVQDGKATRELLQQMASNINKSRRDKLAQDIRKWLSPPDPWKNQNEMNELRHPGTAAWFLNGDMFSKWKSSEQSPFLWIRGIPGAGKSVICSAIIQDINEMRKSQPVALMFFYCDFKDEQKRDLRGLLSSLLVQLCYQSDSYYDLISKLFSEHENGSQHASDAALVRCLKDIMETPRRHPVYLIVDALDECPNPVKLPPRKKVLDFLAELIDSKIPNLHICVTSRPEADIMDALHTLTSNSISLHDEGRHSDDIHDYIKSVVNNDRRMRRWKPQDKQHVIDVLTENSHGMFRWVDCQADYLRSCHVSRIRKVLADVPKTLDETYARVLREIKESDEEFARRIFQCVAVASRPLRVKELAEVFAFDFEAAAIPEFREDWREDDPVDAVLSACSSLLAVVNVEDTQVIQFSHFSVKEFLTSDRFLQANDTISDYHISMTPAHTLVARVCLGTLLHLPEDVTKDSLRKFPLAEYAGEHWVDHARFEDVWQDVEDGMKQLFDPRKSHLLVWVWICDPELPFWKRAERGEIPPGLKGTALHYAAHYGLHRIVKFLITDHSQDVQALGFSNNSTPLHLTSSRGHVELARVLLEHGAVATAQDSNGRTPLHEALFWGHVELARVLLEHGAVATAQDSNGGTPLHEASKGGHVEFARVLLERGAVATAQDSNGWTPLQVASSRGHVELARVLLERGAVATAQSRDGSTPLHWASEGGHVELARVLLEHGAVATAQGWAGRTPLDRASEGGHLELARILLEHGAVATVQDEDGWTPLDRASKGGHLELARVLLEHGAVATVQDEDGWTPLHRASKGGHLELARVLLEHGAVATAQSGDGLTPLYLASPGGHVELAQVLLEHGAVATAQNWDGSTPLHCASFRGHVELARVLLGHGAVATAQSGHGSTPLHEASSGGHVELARVLLEHGAVATAQSGGGWTPLHWASKGGHLELARVLLERGAVATAQSMDRSTPLHEASKGGHLELARVLLEHGAVATAQSGDGSTPLHEASSGGHLELARVLLEHGAVATAQSGGGQTPLHGASSRGHVELARVLLEHGAVATAQDDGGRTPLHWAASGGHVEPARVLLEHGAVATAQDGDGSTPLHRASSSGHVKLARILLEHGAVAMAQNWDGSTPLHWASEGGHVELAQVLLERGAVVTAQDGYGSTPLHGASLKGHVELARVLLEHGAVATAQDGSGLTPLHEASSGGHVTLARVLLEHGAVATARDGNGWAPLHCASFWGRVGLARVLLEHGAVATAQNWGERTPLHWAASEGHVELARVLLKHGAVATAQDGNGSTPLDLASSEGHVELARVLQHESIVTAQGPLIHM